MTGGLRRTICAVAAASLLAGCGARGTLSPAAVLPAAPAQSGSAPIVSMASYRKHRKPVKAVLRIVIPRRKHRGKHADFVSGATMGATLTATNNVTLIVKSVIDLAPSSNDCVSSSGVRTCTVTVLVPIGDDTLTMTTYDRAPVNGAIPNSAGELATGAVTQNVVPGVTPSIAIFLGGVIANIGAGPAFASLPADGSTHSAAFVIAPTDFGNQPITAGKNDPYSNPISVTLTEVNGSGHSNLILNGKNVGSSATLTQSNDTLSLQYDGAGTTGYFTKEEFSATGAPNERDQVAPMYVTSTSSRFTPYKLTLPGQGLSAPVDVAEAGSPPNSQTYTATGKGCSGIATVATTSNTPAAAAFNVTGGATASPAGTCTVTIGDGSSSIVVKVSNTNGSGSIGLPGTTLNVFTSPTVGGVPAEPEALVVGQSGDMWTNDVGPYLQEVTTGGVFTAYTNFTYPETSLTIGPDGAMWSTDQTTPAIVRMAITGTGPTTYYTNTNGALPPGTAPAGIATGPDGNLYFTDSNNDAVDVMTVTGNVNQRLSPNDNVPGSIAAGPDGGMWFTEQSSNAIARIDMNSLLIVETNLPAAISAVPTSIVQGPDGAMWFVIPTLDTIGRMSTDGTFTITSFALPAGTDPTAIARGPDDALYFIESGPNKIGRIDAKTHAVTTFNEGGAGTGASGIVTGPDGNVWYSIPAASQLVQMTP